MAWRSEAVIQALVDLCSANGLPEGSLVRNLDGLFPNFPLKSLLPQQ